MLVSFWCLLLCFRVLFSSPSTTYPAVTLALTSSDCGVEAKAFNVPIRQQAEVTFDAVAKYRDVVIIASLTVVLLRRVRSWKIQHSLGNL
jgi:hypothetical protein